MKRIGIVICVVLAMAMGTLLAGGNAPAPAAGMHTKMMGKTHKLTVEIVSVDVAAKTMTIKDETGADKTVPVMGAALAHLKNYKAGEKVTVTCQDNEKGEHQGITHIMMAGMKSKHAAAAAPK